MSRTEERGQKIKNMRIDEIKRERHHEHLKKKTKDCEEKRKDLM